MITLGMPWLAMTVRKIMFARFCALAPPRTGMKCTYLEKRSTIVRTSWTPLTGGNPEMKSIEMEWNGYGGTGSGLSRPVGAEVVHLDVRQGTQEDTWDLTIAGIPGQE